MTRANHPIIWALPALAVAALTRGDFRWFVIANSLLIWLVAPALVLTWLARRAHLVERVQTGLAQWRNLQREQSRVSLRPPPLRQCQRTLTRLGLTAALSLAAGAAMHQWDTWRVRVFVQHAEQQLDAWKTQTGHYPEHLWQAVDQTPPHLLTEPASYFSNGRDFVFQYTDPSVLMGGYVYSSKVRKWSGYE